MNNLLLAISIIIIFGTMLIIKKFLGKEGLIGWMGIATIMADILISKSVCLLGMEATLGNVLFASNFLATDILTENYGKKAAQKGVMFGAISVLFLLGASQYALLFAPSELDIGQQAMQQLFQFTPRITIASFTLFVLSNFIDVNLYEKMRVLHKGKKMWLRNNLCTIISNGSENFLFYFIAFFGVFAVKDLLWMSLSATIIEITIALCDTPFLYLSKTKCFAKKAENI